MSDRRSLLPLTADESAAVRNLLASTVSQISTIDALLLNSTKMLKSTHEEQQELDAELHTRRKSLLEWTQSKDLLSKALQDFTVRSQPRLPVHLLAANPTAMPLDDELARRLAERKKNDIDSMRVSMDIRKSTIADLRSRVAVLEVGIAGCEATASHIRSMMAVQTRHKDQLNVLLLQYKSGLHPLLRLPDTCLQDIFLHVACLCWERCKRVLVVGEPWNPMVSTYERHPALAITAACYRWRVVATRTPELWSKIIIRDGGMAYHIPRLVHYIHLATDRALSIILHKGSSCFGWGGIHLLKIFESSNVRLDTLCFALSSNLYQSVEIMKVLPSPRALILQGYTISSSVSIPQECLSRMEELTVLGCTATITNTAPALRRFELNLECIYPSTLSSLYLPSLLQRLPQLECLSIRCETNTELDSEPPPLLGSPGVCESVTWLQIPLIALCETLEGLHTSFVLPNLVQLSLLNFLLYGSHIQSWRKFCKLNGGKINHLFLNAGSFMSDCPPLHDPYTPGLADHLHCLPGIKFLSLSVSLMDALLQALKQGRRKGGLLLPNMEMCEIHSPVKTPAFMAKTEEQLGLWSNARNIMRDEAAGRCETVRVLWP